jgi:diguanylate cyclase (GGDEF)-like protein
VTIPTQLDQLVQLDRFATSIEGQLRKKIRPSRLVFGSAAVSICTTALCTVAAFVWGEGIFAIALAAFGSLLSAFGIIVLQLYVNLSVAKLLDRLASIRSERLVDALTGLFNLDAFSRHIAQFDEDQLGSPDLTTYGFVHMDLKGFGDINFRYGYQVGDLIIRRVGTLLLDYASKRRHWFSARIGGDEFVILIIGDHKGKIVQQLGDLAKVLGEGIVVHRAAGDIVLPISMAAGVAWSGEVMGERPRDVLARAEEYTAHAKRTGKDRQHSEIVTHDDIIGHDAPAANNREKSRI